jgi:hypothetical protein
MKSFASDKYHRYLQHAWDENNLVLIGTINQMMIYMTCLKNVSYAYLMLT